MAGWRGNWAGNWHGNWHGGGSAIAARSQDGKGFWRRPAKPKPPTEKSPVSHRKEDEVAAAWALLMSDPW